MSSVVILTLFASAISIVKADTLSSQTEDGFYARGFELVNLGLLIGVSIARPGSSSPSQVDVSIPGTPFPFTDIALNAVVGIVAALLATSLSLPFLDRTVRPSELRLE